MRPVRVKVWFDPGFPSLLKVNDPRSDCRPGPSTPPPKGSQPPLLFWSWFFTDDTSQSNSEGVWLPSSRSNSTPLIVAAAPPLIVCVYTLKELIPELSSSVRSPLKDISPANIELRLKTSVVVTENNRNKDMIISCIITIPQSK